MPTSPAAAAATEASGPVALDSPLRTTPIHPSVPSVKVPDTALTTEPNTNPVTLRPFTEAELEKHGFEKLREQIVGASKSGSGKGGSGVTEKQKQEIERIREETAALLKQKLDERETKVRQIEREMEVKAKTREVERKVFQKKFGAGKDL
ncbi:hypothetical protein A1O1_09103 [Capronia coronata CBS 617.96]|uniref:Uncharacterized protein n=1 Tax=Capronia coronata CBS 617.96 TaxID=1182541 RepID=W9XP06_9EURO|nr:uncharacterized protein A1O1_09103 [Capronia coronata CBS 617.96]EXJ78701.1 hypothetical protein A1O1_09103 [Capronia coronata CBS 617.96]